MTLPVSYEFMLVVLILCAFRISRFITSEEGPFDFMFRIRRWVDPEQDSIALRCPHCVGVWAAAIVVGVYLVGQQYGGNVQAVIDTSLYIIAISGGASFLHDLKQ